ncbi:spermatogenesis-associated protein 32 isoform X1 [Mus musculus]|uniref:spermatogenesis-associated protein 32 isoform X1 n=2 Tax=Mus musculus TaxID=10090 RepID=UPI0003D71887|nr:spermatogenesis-associated protein 32 isoform X1 [Mus musculus]|eukprot:XP_006533645.1 PREDICTED: spermatogenesis-associated protein 32 isoform X1 [Mus musculus]
MEDRTGDPGKGLMRAKGISTFPCCGKDSVDIVERQSDHHRHHHHHTHEENEDEDTEVEAELPRTEPPPKVDPELGPVPQLEEMEPELPSKTTPETEGDSYTESPEQQNYRMESLKPYEEEEMGGRYRSIPVQTSKHLFWSNKLIQASEHSLQKALEKHHRSPQEKSISISQVYTECTQPPSSPPVSRPTTPTAIGLADLINFASSLAVASSSNMALPNLENMIKGTSEKSQNTSLDFCQPVQAIKFAQATQITQISSEKQDESPKSMAHKSWTRETRNVACSYLDINQAGLKTATIQGEVKFVQTPIASPQLQEAKEDSVPGTKKGNPLLLKIHFKLSSPQPQRND